MDEKIKGFLKDFEGYQVALYPHKSMKTEITNININRSLDEVMRLNEQYPSNLYFTPNFQYNNTNSIGSKLDLTDSNANSQWFPCAFVFDFNASRFVWTKQEYLEYIKKTISERIIWEYKYIVETQNGFHVYFVINKDARRAVEMSYWESFFEITEYIAKQLWANCDKKVIERKGALFRLPGSYYWHLSDAVKVEIIESTQAELSFENVAQVATYINNMARSEKDERLAYKKLGVTSYKKILDMTLEEVIKKINRPEIFEWAIVNPELKIVVGQIGQDLKTKPAGSAYQLLWNLCSWDPSATSTAIHKLFGITDTAIPWLDAIETHSIEGKGYSIKFLLGMVQLTQLAPNMKGEYTEKTKIIFRNNIRIIGKGYITSSLMWEATIPRLSIIIEVDGVERVINQMPSKSSHNKAYTDLFFYGDDNDLWLFFNGIVEDQDIPHIDVYERSWYYDNDVVFWNGLIIGDWEFSRVLLWENEFSVAKDVEQISIYEYFNLFKKCYKEEFAVPLFLSAVALWGMNLWNRLEVNPAVLVSGETGCGKSTVAALLKKMLWYDTHAREMALPSISPQPLKQLASDNAILFLEELTQKVWPQTEELLRNIVNRDKAARGTLDWTVRWNFRSPLWVNGERTFKDESLNNRFCWFIMEQDYWMQWWVEAINKLEKYTAYMDIYSIFISARDYINDQLLQYKYKLLDEGFPSRACDVWAYMFTVNDIFNFGYSFKTLVWYVRTHLTKTGLWEKKSKDPLGTFTKLITTSIINRKMSLTINNGKRLEGKPYIVASLLYLDPDVYQQSRWRLYSSIADINNRLTDNYIEIDDSSITFYIQDQRDRKGFTEDNSAVVASILSEIIEMLPVNVTNNIKWIHYYDRW